MPRTLRPTQLPSFSRIPVQRSRALSAYVAIAAAEHPSRPNPNRAYALLGLGAVLLLFSLSLYGAARLVALALGFVCAVVGLLAGLRADSKFRFYASPAEREAALLGDVLSKLDRDRSSQGLDVTLHPNLLLYLEQAAGTWEKIENMRSTQVWKSEPATSNQIAQRAAILMNHVLVSTFARPSSDLASISSPPDLELTELSDTMERATAELLSYPRVGDETSGALAPDEFSAYGELKDLLDSRET